jgi:hypothetical protein
MSFEEKSTWVATVVSVLVAGFYSSFILGQLQSVPVAQIAYQRPMLIAIGAMIIITIVGTILMSIGTAISAGISGSGAVGDIDRTDERDTHINRRGGLAGYYVSSVGVLGGLALAMLRSDQFWIANVLYLGLVVGGFVSSAVKLVAYRRGF